MDLGLLLLLLKEATVGNVNYCRRSSCRGRAMNDWRNDADGRVIGPAASLQSNGGVIKSRADWKPRAPNCHDGRASGGKMRSGKEQRRPGEVKLLRSTWARGRQKHWRPVTLGRLV